MKRVAILFCSLLVLSTSGWAQGADPAQEKLKSLEERIRVLEEQLQAMKSALAAPPPVAPEAKPAEPALGATAPPAAKAPLTQGGGVIGGAPAAQASVLNPNISAIGNFLGAVGKNQVRPVRTLEMHETEIAVQAFVDPFARADFFLSLTPEGIELEEGYLTLTALPGGLVAKVGKMRAAFGKVNALHNDALPWTDRPLVTENLLAGEEGINDAGFSISRILPAPKGIFLEGTAQLFRGESENLFEPSRNRDVSVIGHLRGYGDLSESTNLDLGFSYGRGHTEEGSSFLANLYGVDATFRWKPLRRAIYKSFMARTELVWSRRDTLAGGPAAERAFGLFSSGEYRVNRRWTVGGRYDRSGRAVAAGMTDTGFSALLTYWPSEFSQIRGQYRFARYAEGRDGNELRFQFLFVLGAHGAHPF